MALMTAGADAWAKGLDAWGKLLGATAQAAEKKDRRFSAEEWSENPLFDTIRQSYLTISDRLARQRRRDPGGRCAERARNCGSRPRASSTR